MKNCLFPLVFFLATSNFSLTVLANDSTIAIKPVKVVEPESTQRTVKGAAIDTESFELGISIGSLSIEDFNTNFVYTLSGSYHITQRWLVQANYSASNTKKSTFEEIIDSSFLRDDDRDFKTINMLAGFNLFPGRSFFGKNSKYNSGLYLMLGAGNTTFAGNDKPSFIVGSSYRVVLTDWLTGNVDFRNHIMNREFLTDDKLTHNIEFSLGLNLLF